MLVNGGQVIGDPNITMERWKTNGVIVDNSNGLEKKKAGALTFSTVEIFGMKNKSQLFLAI
jgi:hypothetical protein